MLPSVSDAFDSLPTSAAGLVVLVVLVLVVLVLLVLVVLLEVLLFDAGAAVTTAAAAVVGVGVSAGDVVSGVFAAAIVVEVSSVDTASGLSSAPHAARTSATANPSEIRWRGERCTRATVLGRRGCAVARAERWGELLSPARVRDGVNVSAGRHHVDQRV